MTAASDVEQQRLRYANELAEYTRRQWDMARQSLDRTRPQTQDKPLSNGRSSPSKDSSRASQGQILPFGILKVLDDDHCCRYTVSRLRASLSQAWRKHRT